MSLVEPGQDRTIGPEPVGPAPQPAAVPPVNPTTAEPASEPDTFDRAYVEDLRKENAKWRTQLREYEASFEGVDPDQVKALGEFARLSLAAEGGDVEAARKLEEMLGEEPGEPAPASTPAPTFDEAHFRQLAREEAERIVATERDQTRTQTAIQDVITRAEALGYKHGSPDYVLLMQAANSLETLPEDGDLLRAGDALVKAYKQQIVEEYLSGKEAETNGAPRVPTGGGVAPSQARVPTSWAEARQFLHERLDANG